METLFVAKNARRLRHARQLTQAQVAKKAGISAQTYMKFESRKAMPRMDNLNKIAKALGVGIQDLFIQIRDIKAVRFRAQKKLKRRDQILAKVSKWLDDFNYLLDILGDNNAYKLSKIPSKLKNRSSAQSSLEAAKAARELMRLDEDEPIHDICGLFAANGIKILTYQLASDSFFGMSIGESDGGPAIVVNTWERIPVERWIFSAAHELGHLLLHLNAYDVEITQEDQNQEKEANLFASYFLMPQRGFEKEWSETSGLPIWDRILKVKRIYHVSYKTVLYRLIGMGVFDDLIWKKINAFIKRKYNKSKVPKNFEPERLIEYDFVTDWLDRLVRKAVEKEIISLNRASEILDISLLEARQRAAYWSEEKIAPTF
ncbi:MAG: ImmA/IrrE family metallo-endopeptidase [candidate division Zixibacteria bacterium]|nr:ImmA/IrrE family metallo-endopeptidase [candidate division Zixibacteria bacterium]